MQRSRSKLAILTMLTLLGGIQPARPSSLEMFGTIPDHTVKWSGRTIRVALSTSLTSPSAGIKPDSDVVGAVRNALNTWANAAGIRFEEVTSKSQSISPTSGGDGVNLITIAPTSENLAMFDDGADTARTRLFFDSETGAISEADIALNPFIFGADGSLIEFSTDGTPGTYDLESTLAHEIGHLLGLNHSSVIGSTMRPMQALNGTYGLAAISQRTLSEVDIAAVRAIYGSRDDLGTVEGRILFSNEGNLVPVTRALIWLEDVSTGRVMANSLTATGGKFSISGLAPGEYRAMIEYLDEKTLVELGDQKSSGRRRAFRSGEISSNLQIDAGKTTQLNYVLVPPQNAPPVLNPQTLGTKGDLSTVAVSATPGTKLTLFISGKGMDDIPGSGLSVSSPYLSIDPASLSAQTAGRSTTVISFELSLAANTPPGDYSIRLQSNSGEIAYLIGAVTVDLNP